MIAPTTCHIKFLVSYQRLWITQLDVWTFCVEASWEGKWYCSSELIASKVNNRCTTYQNNHVGVPPRLAPPTSYHPTCQPVSWISDCWLMRLVARCWDLSIDANVNIKYYANIMNYFVGNVGDLGKRNTPDQLKLLVMAARLAHNLLITRITLGTLHIIRIYFPEPWRSNWCELLCHRVRKAHLHVTVVLTLWPASHGVR